MLRTKLSAMMFLQFFIWGAWLPPSFSYFDKGELGFEPWQQTLINGAFPVSAIIAMFFANQFVDRNFAAERYLAFSHFVGGLAIMGMTFTKDFWPLFALMSVHCFFYVPTISVTNAIAFANLKDPQKDFGPVRLWGTIGWIAASWPFVFILLDWAGKDMTGKPLIPPMSETKGFVDWLGIALDNPATGAALLDGKRWAFFVAGVASLVLAGVSLVLPHTPPKPASGEDKFAFLEALKLLRHPFMYVLFVVTLIDAMVHDGFFYFAYGYLGVVGVPSNWIQPAMTVGQVAEIATMAFLGYVLKSFGWRTTMIVGILGHAVRFAVFALVPDPYVCVAVNVLHGICYAFFFATLYIFVDEFFPKDARTSAQGLFNFLILGMGPIIARVVWPMLKTAFTVEKIVPGVEGAADTIVKEVQYRGLLLIPSGLAIFAAVLLILFFHPPKRAEGLEEKKPILTH